MQLEDQQTHFDDEHIDSAPFAGTNVDLAAKIHYHYLASILQDKALNEELFEKLNTSGSLQEFLFFYYQLVERIKEARKKEEKDNAQFLEVLAGESEYIECAANNIADKEVLLDRIDQQNFPGEIFSPIPVARIPEILQVSINISNWLLALYGMQGRIAQLQFDSENVNDVERPFYQQTLDCLELFLKELDKCHYPKYNPTAQQIKERMTQLSEELKCEINELRNVLPIRNTADLLLDIDKIAKTLARIDFLYEHGIFRLADINRKNILTP